MQNVSPPSDILFMESRQLWTYIKMKHQVAKLEDKVTIDALELTEGFNPSRCILLREDVDRNRHYDGIIVTGNIIAAETVIFSCELVAFERGSDKYLGYYAGYCVGLLSHRVVPCNALNTTINVRSVNQLPRINIAFSMSNAQDNQIIKDKAFLEEQHLRILTEYYRNRGYIS